MGNGHSAIDKLIALTTLRQYQNGGQVLQIPQKKELDIVWPDVPESVFETPEDVEESKYNPINELYWDTLLKDFLNQSRSRQFKDSGAPSPPRGYLDSGHSPEEHPMFRPPRVLEPGPSPEDTEDIMKEIIKKFKDVQLGRGVAKSGGLVKNYKEGGKTSKSKKRSKDVPSLTDVSPSRTQKIQDFLTRVTEKSPLVDWMYHSPEESFDKVLRGGYSSSIKNKSDLFLTDDDIKELWKQAGKPRVKLNRKKGEMSGAGYFKPRGYKWDYGRKNPLTFLGKLFGSDKIYVPRGFGSDLAISELAHSMRFKDPKRYSKYDTRHDLMMGKGTEHVGGYDESLYGRPGTDEYQTHKVVEPMLRKWLIENYGKDEAGIDEYYKKLFGK